MVEQSHSTIIKKIAEGIKDFYLPKDKVRFKEMIEIKFSINIETKKQWEGQHHRKKIGLTASQMEAKMRTPCAHIMRARGLILKGYRNLGK